MLKSELSPLLIVKGLNSGPAEGKAEQTSEGPGPSKLTTSDKKAFESHLHGSLKNARLPLFVF